MGFSEQSGRDMGGLFCGFDGNFLIQSQVEYTHSFFCVHPIRGCSSSREPASYFLFFQLAVHPGKISASHELNGDSVTGGNWCTNAELLSFSPFYS